MEPLCQASIWSVCLSELMHPMRRASASSKYRGVRWHPHNNKWEARIFNGAKQARSSP